MFTEKQILDGFAEIKRQSKNNTVSGFYWPALEKALGKSTQGFFLELMDRGMLREEIVPNTYGHAIHHITA